MLTRAAAAAAAAVVLLGWAYNALQPPPPKTCGSPDGPPITAPRVQLSDGRHLAYREEGTPKDKASYKIIVVHGFDSSKDDKLPVSQELVDELGIYLLSFDRAGYGESDPNPKRTVKSEAMDIQELADRMDIGSKFYLLGISMGGYPTWSCLNYIPHRLAGAALIVPAVNYWWPSFPADLSRRVYGRLPVQDRRTLWIAHHAPPLLYGWMTQKWLPTILDSIKDPAIMNPQDVEIMQERIAYLNSIGIKYKAQQQGVFESLYRDLMIGFGNWEFDPMNISNPFPYNEGSVHIWQGYKDTLVPVELQRYVADKLTWIRYHENPKEGHLFIYTDDWCNTVITALLRGKEPTPK